MMGPVIGSLVGSGLFWLFIRWKEGQQDWNSGFGACWLAIAAGSLVGLLSLL